MRKLRMKPTGPDQSVHDALNEIRDRADMPDIPTGLTQNEMRDVIRLERRIELAGEGHYYQDIRRWRTAEVVMNAIVYNSAGEVRQTRTFQ
jgi:starch-binding outer membrane protein, SusD/RagB family